MSPKEIAEFYSTGSDELPTTILARAYLELERVYKFLQEQESQNDVYIEMLLMEIDKRGDEISKLTGTLEEIGADMYVGYKKSCSCGEAANKALEKGEQLTKEEIEKIMDDEADRCEKELEEPK